jgi:hypothetical protein
MDWNRSFNQGEAAMSVIVTIAAKQTNRNLCISLLVFKCLVATNNN